MFWKGNFSHDGPAGEREGILLLNACLIPLYIDREAVEILTYPENSQNIKSQLDFLTSKIQSTLAQHSSSPAGFVHEFVSGRRRYQCRAFQLQSGTGNLHDNEPIFAVLLERPPRLALDSLRIAEKFHLTRRERETMELVLQGLTAKEIASRMNISPHTVKAFIKLIMVKTGTTTRSAIAGKVIPLGVKKV